MGLITSSEIEKKVKPCSRKLFDFNYSMSIFLSALLLDPTIDLDINIVAGTDGDVELQILPNEYDNDYNFSTVKLGDESIVNRVKFEALKTQVKYYLEKRKDFKDYTHMGWEDILEKSIENLAYHHKFKDYCLDKFQHKENVLRHCIRGMNLIRKYLFENNYDFNVEVPLTTTCYILNRYMENDYKETAINEKTFCEDLDVISGVYNIIKTDASTGDCFLNDSLATNNYEEDELTSLMALALIDSYEIDMKNFEILDDSELDNTVRFIRIRSRENEAQINAYRTSAIMSGDNQNLKKDFENLVLNDFQFFQAEIDDLKYVCFSKLTLSNGKQIESDVFPVMDKTHIDEVIQDTIESQDKMIMMY